MLFWPTFIPATHVLKRMLCFSLGLRDMERWKVERGANCVLELMVGYPSYSLETPLRAQQHWTKQKEKSNPLTSHPQNPLQNLEGHFHDFQTQTALPGPGSHSPALPKDAAASGPQCTAAPRWRRPVRAGLAAAPRRSPALKAALLLFISLSLPGLPAPERRTNLRSLAGPVRISRAGSASRGSRRRRAAW